jgi:hypothetical protein
MSVLISFRSYPRQDITNVLIKDASPLKEKKPFSSQYTPWCLSFTSTTAKGMPCRWRSMTLPTKTLFCAQQESDSISAVIKNRYLMVGQK